MIAGVRMTETELERERMTGQQGAEDETRWAAVTVMAKCRAAVLSHVRLGWLYDTLKN